MAVTPKNNAKEAIDVAEVAEVAEPSNDSLVVVTNTRPVHVLGIAPGHSGEVTYGLFKSTIGLNLE